MKNKCDVSFIIPSIKPYSKFGKLVVDSICDNTKKYISHEIIYCSPTDPRDKRVKFVKENNSEGEIHVYNEMAKNHANGDHLICISDDHQVGPNVFHSVFFLQSNLFKDRKYKICTLASNSPCFLPPTFGPDWKPSWKKLPKNLVMRFPVIHKKTFLEHLNGFVWHPKLKTKFADNYLGHFLGENNEPGLECSMSRLYEIPESLKMQQKSEPGKLYYQTYDECIRLLNSYKRGMPYDF